MGTIGKIIGINILIWVVIVITISLLESIELVSMGVYSFFCALVQGIINIHIGVIFLFEGNKQRGQGFVLSAVVIGLIGLSACFGSLMSWDPN